MLQKSFHRTLDYLLVFSLFLLSNIPAFLTIIWLIPDFVLLECVAWFMLIMLTVWKLKKDNMSLNFVNNLKKNWIILPFFVFSGLSVFWSIYWEISFYRILILLFTIIAGGYIGLKYDLKRMIEILSIFGIFILLFGALLIVFVPNLGVMNYYNIQGAWRGMYWHKNHFGLITSFINILFLINLIYPFQSQGKRKQALLWGGLYLISFVFVYQSDSVAAYLTTSILHGLIFLALLLFKFGKKLHRSHYLVFLVILLLLATVLFINLDTVFGLFNRNTTLTGRIPMWTHLFDTYINKRPFGGYGFNAFWYLSSHRVELGQAAGYPERIVISDNGFLDILVNTGYVGLGLFLLFYSSAWWRSVKYSVRANDIIGVFPVILMSFTLVANISWSLMFENEGFFMLIMIAVLFFVTNNKPTDRGD